MDCHSSKLSDTQLCQMLRQCGIEAGPITPATRPTYEKKLAEKTAISTEIHKTVTEQELAEELKKCGIKVGPITPTTRSTYERILLKKSKAHRKSSAATGICVRSKKNMKDPVNIGGNTSIKTEVAEGGNESNTDADIDSSGDSSQSVTQRKTQHSDDVEQNIADQEATVDTESEAKIAMLSETICTTREELKLIRQQNRELEDEKMCKICLGEAITTTFVPCGHFVTCTECAGRVVDCPMCRSHVDSRVLTYMN